MRAKFAQGAPVILCACRIAKTVGEHARIWVDFVYPFENVQIGKSTTVRMIMHLLGDAHVQGPLMLNRVRTGNSTGASEMDDDPVLSTSTAVVLDLGTETNPRHALSPKLPDSSLGISSNATDFT
jgi:hypothetical protein